MATRWLNGSFTTFIHRDAIIAIPTTWQSLYEKMKDRLHILHAGITMGTPKGKDIVPDESLALSITMKLAAFPTIDVNYDTTIRFLRKEAITLPEDTPRQFVLITHQQQPIGFVKNIGNRANNLYPSEWKIKSTHLPDHPVHVVSQTE